MLKRSVLRGSMGNPKEKRPFKAVPYRWYQYYWRFIQHFGQECYRTWRLELAAGVLVGFFVAVLNRAWNDFRTAVLATALTLGVFVVWHLLRLPWLLHESMHAGENEPGTLAGVFGLLVLAASLGGGFKLVKHTVSEIALKAGAPISGRHLSRQDMYAMFQILRDQRNVGRVEIVSNEADEPYDLANQLNYVFWQSGWFVGDPIPPVLMSAGPMPVGELTVSYRTQDDKQHEFVERALKAANLSYDSRYDPTGTTPNVNVSIYVGLQKKKEQ